MPRRDLPLLLPLILLTPIRLVSSAPTPRVVLDSHESRNNPIFDPSRYSSISEWFAAQGRILEITNNATQKCLAHFTIKEDNSVCFGNDKWDWNAVAVICVLGIIAGIMVITWLCSYWAQTGILWMLGDKENGVRSIREGKRRETSTDDEADSQMRTKPEDDDRRVDSVHSQSTGGEMQSKGTEPEEMVDSVHSEPIETDPHATTVHPGDGLTSESSAFDESDKALRSLGWLP